MLRMHKMLYGLGLLFIAPNAAAQSGTTTSTLPGIHIKTVPPDFYAQKLGFICKKELRIQKATGLGLYLRLGSKEYVDYLEQKQKNSSHSPFYLFKP